MSKKYYALIADLIDSRAYDIEGRVEIQLLLRDSIEIVNLLFRRELDCPLSFSGGDAVECLGRSRSSLLGCVLLLRGLMWRVPIRFAIGERDWTVRMMDGVTPLDVNQQDGPVFWLTRDLLETGRSYDLVLSVRKYPPLEQRLLVTLVEIEQMQSYDEVERLLLRRLWKRIGRLSYPEQDGLKRLMETMKWSIRNQK